MNSSMVTVVHHKPSAHTIIFSVSLFFSIVVSMLSHLVLRAINNGLAKGLIIGIGLKRILVFHLQISF